ncbi:kielin/chordin-like protein [Leucoraja erinacea]|uniref:kielin/chordin-like protein n=1 Tax=Leucoraja erinaceus TaxID=7782 RepID=UPI002455DE27|nr:kielin/chordin-like protein [Leucoraja erinacea]
MAMSGLKTLCVLLCVLRADGRGYPGRKRGVQKHYSTAMQRYRHGPHMCQSRYGSGCCLGWRRTLGSGLCVMPVCSFGCGNGYCVAPNLCFCRGGQGISCSDDGRSSQLFSDLLLNHSDSEGNPPSCLNMHCDQSCALIGGMPVCSCYIGYSLGKNGKTCYDVDECSRYGGQSLCQQICKNNIGSYRCLCYQGYQLLANGRTCITSKYFGLTEVSAWCGEYGCDMSCNHGGCEEMSRVCPVGFTMIETSIGISCKDINECSTASCKGQCVNKEGGFVCDCRAGMQLSPDKHSCVDIDECAGNGSPCQQRCQNVIGSFKCSCRPGYYLHNNGHLCTDVNECRWVGESRVCHHSCHNTFGTYLCSCRAGFRLQTDRRSCEDIDECKEDVSLCKSRCLNVIGSYRCACMEGFLMVEGQCQDRDECSYHSGRICQQACMNTVGSFLCSCEDGYSLAADDFSCVDMDECETFGDALCEHKCINTIGSFKCSCPLGYEMFADGQMCIDVNECEKSNCSHHCANTLGSFQCLCPHGYTLHTNGHNCQDNNECAASGNGHCVHNCVNTAGSYYCTCHPGYRLHFNRHSCIPDRVCQSCQSECPTGFSLLPNGVDCTDIDECLSNPCSHHCHNTEGSFYCTCPDGFRLNVNNTCTEPPLAPGPVMESLKQPFPAAILGTPWTPPTSCRFNESLHQDGSTWTVSDCVKCICELGSAVCTTCPSLPCTKTELLPGVCCPVCKSCVSDGSIYAHNSSWISPSQPCLTCSCQEGEVLCQFIVCKTSCSHQVLEEGQCCGTCENCLYEGRTVDHEAVFSPSNDNCTLCACISGNVKCITPECPPVTCKKPVQLDCCPSCPAECIDQGIVYPHGAEFTRPGTDCISCACLNGEVECYYRPCPVLECAREEWFIEPNQCCFTCRQDKSLVGCYIDDNGIEFPVGQIWSPGDPCEVCVCQADGSIVCKRTECLETCAHPILIPGQCCPDCSAGCAYGGMIYQNNETFPSTADSCLACICLSGSAACSPVECKVRCTYPFHSEGECCPLCMDCNYEGRKVTNGQTFQPEHRPCHHCVCQLGEVSCEVRKCEPPSCEHPHPVPGDCCPTCSVCLYDGQILEDGTYYISAADPCVVCLCTKGNVECDWKGDSCTELECEQPLHHVPGTCCPICSALSMSSTSTETSGLHPPITDNTLPEIPVPTQSYQSPQQATAQLPTSDAEVALTSLAPLSSATSKKYNLNQIIPWSIKRKQARELNTSSESQGIAAIKQPMTMEMNNHSDGISWENSKSGVVLTPAATTETTLSESAEIKDEIVQEDLSCLDEDGVVFSHGQNVPREDPCTICLCLEGTVLCESQKEQCQVLLCDVMQQMTPEGHCCPICIDSRWCVHHNQIREAQTQWLHGCDLCHCNNGNVECQTKSCSVPNTCPPQYILSQPEGECCTTCVKIKPQNSSCTVFGESHYMTFDGLFYDLNGACAYLLAKDCESNRFNVVYYNKINGNSSQFGKKTLIVQTENRTIELSTGSLIQVNNTEVELTYSASNISIHHSGLYVILQLPSGLSITWDGNNFVELNAHQSLQSKLCGLCGNYNGNKSDDFALPGGEVVSSPIEFGNGWLIKQKNDSLCTTKSTEDPCNGTGRHYHHSANNTCSIIMGPSFEPAHGSIDPQPYYRACLEDSCACVEQTGCLCSILSAYAFRALRLGIILTWRNKTLCGVTCNGGSSYSECSCQQTCATHLWSDIRCSTSSCVPGCQCSAGLLMHQSNCLPPSLCPLESLHPPNSDPGF